MDAIPTEATPHPSMEATPHRGMDGAALSPLTWVLMVCGTAGGLLFTAVYLVEGATRPGYDAWAQAISALSLGPGGWVQQANFVVFGILMLASAVGWRRVLRPGAGALSYPILRAIVGAGLIVAGFFSQDPAPGYPPGASITAPSVHGEIHVLSAFVIIIALAFSCLALARRFAVELRWRGWAIFSAITGVLTIVFMSMFGATNGHSPSGIYERLAAGVESLLLLLVVARLAVQAWRGTP